ncbi:MAG: esterase-like activity of phytase family protein [Polaromonas sp.]
MSVLKQMNALTLAAACALCLASGVGRAEPAPAVEAILAGHAALPATGVVPAPRDAGPFFATAGKFANARRQRNEQLGSEAANTFVGDPKYPRASGGVLPMKGQSVQGFSGIVSLGKGEFLVLTDNGFGNKINSQDALLMVHRMSVNWGTGQAARRGTTFLSDPNKRVPFHIQNENTQRRYLTGIDFDPESLQVVGNEWWIGDEFGPYILRTDFQGRVLGVIETVVNGKRLASPDHYLQGRLPNLPGEALFEVRRSNGFEAMAKSPDGSKLYPMFEGPLFDAASKSVEKVGDRTYVRINEVDAASRAYTGKQWKYALEEVGHVAADFQLLDATTGLVIERDDATEGQAPACPNEARTDCFTRPARFKRVYKIDLSAVDADGFVRKVAYIDLTRIANPRRLAKLGPNEANFVLPHLGPEGLAVVDATHIVLVNDNNFPFSSGRVIGKPDDNELTLLDIRALIEAK